MQLKDKARNLKLSFLKAGHPVPKVLEKVTGCLGRARRGENEGKEKKRKLGNGEGEADTSMSQSSGLTNAW